MSISICIKTCCIFKFKISDHSQFWKMYGSVLHFIKFAGQFCLSYSSKFYPTIIIRIWETKTVSNYKQRRKSVCHGQNSFLKATKFFRRLECRFVNFGHKFLPLRACSKWIGWTRIKAICFDAHLKLAVHYVYYLIPDQPYKRWLYIRILSFIIMLQPLILDRKTDKIVG